MELSVVFGLCENVNLRDYICLRWDMSDVGKGLFHTKGDGGLSFRLGDM